MDNKKKYIFCDCECCKFNGYEQDIKRNICIKESITIDDNCNCNDFEFEYRRSNYDFW